MKRLTAILMTLICLTAFLSVPVSAASNDLSTFTVNGVNNPTTTAEQKVSITIYESLDNIQSIIVYMGDDDRIFAKYEKGSTDPGISIQGSYVIYRCTITENEKYRFCVENTAGNVSEQIYNITCIDETAPVINDDLTEPTDWTNEHTFVIKPTDEGTGINEIVVNKDGKEICKASLSDNSTTPSDTAWFEGSKYTITCTNGYALNQTGENDFELTVKENGNYEFIIKDKANNESKKAIKVEKIDTTAPEIKVSEAPANIKALEFTFDITASDNVNGSNIKEIRVYEGVYNPENTQFKPITLDKNNSAKYTVKEGTYTFIATDNASNMSEPAERTFTADKIKVLLDNKHVDFDVLPIIDNGRTLVPLRAIFEALGAEVNWDENTNTITATKNGIKVTLNLKDEPNILNVNSDIKTLDVPAKIVDGRTLVPVRAISESFCCNVGWDADTKTVVISSPTNVINKSENETYIGEIGADGNPSGNGTLYYITANGSVGCDKGIWNGFDLFDGIRNITYSNGDKYTGGFKNGKKHGSGTYFFAKYNNKPIPGVWENNVQIQ